MKALLWLIPALPYTGALILIMIGSSIARSLVPWIGAGSVGLSALITILIGLEFIPSPEAYHQVLWTWMDVAGFSPQVALHLDSLSLVFIFVITFVGFLIHVYSAEFMRDDEGYSR